MLERYKPECEGVLKRPSKLELPKQGENKVPFTSYQKHTKAPFVIYVDIECLLRRFRAANRHKAEATPRKRRIVNRADSLTQSPKMKSKHPTPLFTEGRTPPMSSLPISRKRKVAYELWRPTKSQGVMTRKD